MELYIHIPFCRQKCRYCAFASFAGKEDEAEAYVNLLIREASMRLNEVREPIDTVYLGGGTPSLLPPALLRRLVSGLGKLLDLDHVAEFTSEANPGTVTPAWLETAASSGVSRLSFGMQASQDDLLFLLGRIHRFEDVERSFFLARSAGFENLSLDLIFGIPTQTRSAWRESLRLALRLRPCHISAYGLIPEEGTPLYGDLENGTLSLPDPEEERAMYGDALGLLAKENFEQYEISSFAKKGCECRHNIGYWTQVPYLGLGVAAASMTDVSFASDGMSYLRKTNPGTLSAYRRMIETADFPLPERIPTREAAFETLMLGLRMNRGVGETDFLRLHGVTMEQRFGPKLRALERNGLLIHENNRWRMTPRGFDIQNSVLVELMD